jgi:hypothetical protein
LCSVTTLLEIAVDDLLGVDDEKKSGTKVRVQTLREWIVEKQQAQHRKGGRGRGNKIDGAWVDGKWLGRNGLLADVVAERTQALQRTLCEDREVDTAAVAPPPPVDFDVMLRRR